MNNNVAEQWRKDRLRDARIQARAELLAEREEVVADRLERRNTRIASGHQVCRCHLCRYGQCEVVVYFMREPDGPVKIGITHIGVVSTMVYSVESRRCTIESGSGRRMVLLAHIPGSTALEAEIHRRFAHLRTIGEWFRPEPELLDFITSLSGAR